MKIQTSELSGAALDYAVSVCVGFKYGSPRKVIDQIHFPLSRPDWNTLGVAVLMPDGAWNPNVPKYSSIWSVGGRLIDSSCTAFHRDADGTCWATVGLSQCSGNDILEAFLRALVTERSGPEVDVPDELVKVNNNDR